LIWDVLSRLDSVGAAELGFDDRIIKANEAFARILGYDDAELIGMSKVQLVAPENRMAAMQRYMDFAANRKNHAYTQAPLIRSNGARVWCSIESVTLYNDTGERTSRLVLLYEIPGGDQQVKVEDLEHKLQAVQEIVATLAHQLASKTAQVVLNVNQLDDGSQVNQGGTVDGKLTNTNTRLP
jgi:PAS domain S-box-containing protein